VHSKHLFVNPLENFEADEEPTTYSKFKFEHFWFRFFKSE